jgi:Zn-dependent protease
MGWSITVGSVAGTAVRIHVTFLLLLVWIFGVNYFSGGPPAAWGALVFVVLLFLCVLLHEFGHIFTMTTLTAGPAMATRNSSLGFSGMRSSRDTPPIGSKITSGVETPKARAVVF